MLRTLHPAPNKLKLASMGVLDKFPFGKGSVYYQLITMQYEGKNHSKIAIQLHSPQIGSYLMIPEIHYILMDSDHKVMQPNNTTTAMG